MAKRQCDVTFVAGNGKRHTITVEAESAYHAAVLFYSASAAPSPGVVLPRVTADCVLEVSPSYKIRLKDALAWANREANKANKKREAR